MIEVTSRGDYSRTKKFIDRLFHSDELVDLDLYGQMGVESLKAATPKDTGLTSESWGFRITREGIWTGIDWFNTNLSEEGGPSVAVLIQYGHATRSGSYILGIDYINPAMDHLFDFIVDDVWKKVNHE